MNFGLMTLMDFHPQLQDEATYIRDTLDLFELSERLGFSTAWLGEEHFYNFGVCPSPQVMLAMLAARTTSLRLGTAISLLPFENPLRKAEDFALLDVLSRGRLNFGTGRGSIPKHFQGFNINARESRDRYEEALTIIRGLWTNERFGYDGQYWQFPELSLSPRPIQKPMPPVWRGTVSLESFEQAGRDGDNVFLIPWVAEPVEEMGRRHRVYKDLLAENGHTQRQSTAVYHLFLDRTHEAAMQRGKIESKRYAERITDRAMHTSTTKFQPGSAAFKHAQYVLSLTDNLEERAIVGTPQTCIERIRELDEKLGGVSEFAFYLHAGARSTRDARTMLELFSNEVLPAFRSQPATAASQEPALAQTSDTI